MKKARNFICFLLFLLILVTSVSAYNTGDDYPAKYKNYAIDSIVDEWNFYNRECTSFVAWCLNSRNGIHFTNQYAGASKWGNASTWGTVAQGLGISVNKSPAVGSVAWWSSGHVAWVNSVSGNNVVIEEYNYNWTGEYSIRTISSSNPTGYIHIKDIPIDTEKPQISDVTYKRTPDGYIASCKATDNTGIKKVVFPTWTAKNGQDDLNSQWNTENSTVKGTQNGNYYTFRIKMSDHNNEEGIYYTHIYAYDEYGNETSASLTINVYKDTEAPVIKNVRISEKDKNGYVVKCDVTDNKKLDRVQFPTWTAYNSQDDLRGDWETSAMYSGTIQNNTVTFRVNISDHNNENGIYKTHIYAYDECGNFSNATQLIWVNNNGYSPISELKSNGRKYAFFDNPYNLNWNELKQYCELIGGHLAVITSPTENALLTKEALRIGKTYYFIGASDEEHEGVWKWVTGEAWSYTNWETGEPNNLNNENYLAITKQGKWNDLALEHDAGFICEFENPKPNTQSTVIMSNNTYIITPVFRNVNSGKVFIAGYKNNRMIVLKSNSYAPDFKPISLVGDIDLIKVTVWDSINNMKPITNSEEIPKSDWLTK